MTVLVLCLFRYATKSGYWHHDSLMVDVAASSLIIPAFEQVMRERQAGWVYGFSSGPRPERWELTSYRPKNGKAEFDERH